jgi:membrane glycosyltransferase
MAYLMAATLFVASPDLLGIAMMIAFLATLPWTVVGFWNAVIGFALMTCSRDPFRTLAPWLAEDLEGDRVTASTALLVCVRNEDPARLERNLAWMTSDLAGCTGADRFHVYVLSDSSDPKLAAAEAHLTAELQARLGATIPITYRRREHRAGFKAGNIRDFCERWGNRHDFAIVLDADSLMTARAMLRLVRTMQREPRLGILQTLVTGLPSASAFARIFQFGMRLGMRSYTLGSAWWQADCGPYWGHNAIIRLAPFIEHCRLPTLPSGADVLSHDQIEAVLMRRAGYEVRVLVEEGGSWEENPPHLAEFIRRDLRWCEGNMQYVHLIGMPGLAPLSRIQIALAVAMYLSPLGWMSFLLLGVVRGMPIREETGFLLFAITVAMTFAPKIATLIQALSRARVRQAFGGTVRILLGVTIEFVFWTLLAPVCAIAVSLFLLGLPFGLGTGWSSQQRDAVGLPLAQAASKLWPQTLLGIVLLAWLISMAPGVFWWLALPVYVGLAVCIPVAWLTAHPAFGRALQRIGICRIPEETPSAFDIRLPRPFAPLMPVTDDRRP